jgi:hypothetical protein
VLGLVVAHADGAHPTVGEQVLRGLVRGERVLERGRDRPVQQVQVDMVQAELGRAGIECAQGCVVPVVVEPQLGGDEDVIAVDT